MLVRAALIWCLLVVAAIANGAVRVAWIIPRAGDYWGHVISTATLSILILAIAWLCIAWIGPSSAADALRIGTTWLVMTIAFEFLAGHYLFGNSWERLLADYNVLQGRVWVIVLVVTFIAPLLTRRAP